MRKVILRDQRKIFPFNEPARELRVLNKPLWLYQRDLCAPYITEEREVDSLSDIDSRRVETLVYRDNLFFDQFFLRDFIQQAQGAGKACRVAFALDDNAINTHAAHLQRGIQREGNVYVADMWYFPYGVEPNVRPLVINTGAHEMGYYHVPTHMSNSLGDLVYQVPIKAFCSIEHWVHTITANVIFGVMANGARLDIASESIGKQLKMLWRAMLERRNVHTSSEVVYVGRNCSIDPTAIIKGPTYIGNNVSIGPGAVIDISIIGDNVSIAQGGQVQWSVVSDRCFLPFRAAIFSSVMMEDGMLAQNTCLQFCSVGRGTFIGAGSTFTDFSLVPSKPIRAIYDGKPSDTGMPVLGGCVGHNCFVGSGMVVHPARAIESDAIVFASPERRVINRTVYYEDSDHLTLEGGADLHTRMYER
ncbi:MAG: multidrug transporter [Chloroflexota bacterium]|nr:multidrug transporter [Chloroflexota bacterium]